MLWTILRWGDLVNSLPGANLILERLQRVGFSQTYVSENHCIRPIINKQVLRQGPTNAADRHIA